jgi:hypothetical protein
VAQQREATALSRRLTLPLLLIEAEHRMLDLPHVASRAFGTPLMIARAKLEVILGVLAPRFAGDPIEGAKSATEPVPLTSVTGERIAVVSVIGTLVSRSGYLDASSGLSSYADMGEAIASTMSAKVSNTIGSRAPRCSEFHQRSAWMGLPPGVIEQHTRKPNMRRGPILLLTRFQCWPTLQPCRGQLLFRSALPPVHRSALASPRSVLTPPKRELVLMSRTAYFNRRISEIRC